MELEIENSIIESISRNAFKNTLENLDLNIGGPK